MSKSAVWSVVTAALFASSMVGLSVADDRFAWPARNTVPWDQADFNQWERIIRDPQEEASVYDEPLETDRPDFTETSSVVGRGVLQIEMGYTFSCDDEAGTRTRSHSTPETLFRYGISDNVELRLVWNYAWQDTTTAGVVDEIDGAEDLVVGVKLALTSQQDWIPESAIVLHMTTPTGGNDVTTQHAEFESNYLYGWDLACDTSFAGSCGYSTSTEFATVVIPGVGLSDVADRHGIFHSSVTYAVPLWDPWRAYFEYFGLYFDGLSGGRPQNYFDSGITYLLNNNVQFDARVGAGLNPSADDFFAGVGMAVRL